MPSNKSDALFPPPWVEGSLANLVGGALNVIPLDLLKAPLRVDVTPWDSGSPPTPGRPETLMLMWDGVQVGALKQWTAPIAADDYFVEIPVQDLKNDATPDLTYRVKAYNGAEQDSAPLTITLDLTGPSLGADRGALLFDDEVMRDGITEDYLNRHDPVIALLPDYQTFVPGDHIRWFWDTQLYENNLVAEKVLEQGDLPVTVEIPGDVILDRGDGARFAHYLLCDYAGNPSTPVEPKVVQLQVDAAPVPRDLSWPEVSHAVGEEQQVVLDLNSRMTYMRVKVPTGAALPGETIEVFWGEPGRVGSYQTSAEASGFPHEYEIPLDRIAPHSGKVLTVYFEVTETTGGNVHTSLSRLVLCLPLNQGLPRPDVHPSSNDTVYLSQVPADGLTITLAAWKYIHADHRVTLVVGGVDTQGQPSTQEALKEHALTPAEVQNGLGFDDTVKATKPFLMSLKRDKLSVRVFVSFDQGETWPEEANFPLLDLGLRD
ncbi:hypothetical protein QVM62_26710 [Pseudomonas putida]|uniref:hypothetical protein n=1 Tax=Pseudomonas putida TaxID=303 RepID=UPI0035239D9C